jgi:type II secretory pathway pseudopilin PulG
MNIKNKTKKNTAFTLLELVFTMLIMGIIVGMATPIMTQSQYLNELKSEAVKLESIIKKSRNLAMTGSYSSLSGGVPTEGYGVNFSSNNRATLFVNIIDSNLYQYEAGSGEDYGSFETDDVVVMNPNVVFDHFSNKSGTVITSDIGVNIIFLPPNGNIELSDNGVDGVSAFSDTEMNITIRHTESGGCFKLTVNEVTGRLFRNTSDCT